MTSDSSNDHVNPLIAEHIGPYYVYLLVDPQNDEVFYVGKGQGWRFTAHLKDDVLGNDAISDEEAGAKLARIRAIQKGSQQPRVEFARIQIRSEEEALLVEATLIDVLRRYGGSGLTNAVRGHDADLGLITLEQLQEQLATPILDTHLRALLIKLNWWAPTNDTELPRQGYGYRSGMSDQELYDSTRAWWRIDTGRAKAYPYAVAIFQGVTRAIYTIDHTSWQKWDPKLHPEEPPRVAFKGTRLWDGDAFNAFVGVRGKRIPPTRPNGHAVFGTGSPIAYWPD